ncbi:MAG: mechanosensitive ion channel family protein [Gemmatimonadetes bacterium]|nr:mechanosensitive ion channel family protein [Gemmatimonadota bacterium]
MPVLSQQDQTAAEGIAQGLREAGDSLRAQVDAVREFRFVDAINWPALFADGIRIILIILLAFATYRILKVFTGRLQREVDEPDLSRKRLREQRAHTVASLLNNVGMITIVVLAFLMILGTFMPIGPLLAGVGVLGLAVSFGAQSLVKDLISGAFMLVEGQFAVGDVVRVKETAGMVEKITLRTIVLRDINGIVHIIPNGTVDTLSNLTKSWSRAVLEIGVAYKEDVDRVMDVMKDEAMKMYADPEWEPLIVEEPVVPGVERFDDSAVTIRIMFKTLPLKQWEVARQYRRRIKNRFDAEGIEIPFPHRTLYWGAGENPAIPVELGGETGPAAAAGVAGE